MRRPIWRRSLRWEKTKAWEVEGFEMQMFNQRLPHRADLLQQEDREGQICCLRKIVHGTRRTD
ncbi:hypothetical protein [Alistipes putredinis]|uniref:hypothetical protein n=1 Tax=Alistipes putredinis TaxID=28117 RepID=UPI0039967A06